MPRKPTRSKAPVAFVKSAARSEKSQSNLKPFQKGQSGNPAGRPKGSRDSINEAFLKDFALVWKEGGLEAIRKVATTDPSTFIKVAAGLLPRDVNVAGDINHQHDHQHRAVSETAGWLANVLGSGSDSASEKSKPH